jgi:hypothetical protein
MRGAEEGLESETQRSQREPGSRSEERVCLRGYLDWLPGAASWIGYLGWFAESA